MTCREAIEVLADYVEGAMPPEHAAELERHLAGCEPCRAYLATYRKTRALGAAAVRLDMPAEMRARLHRFLVDQLRRG
jgi:anti-sigma factor RsiW